MASRERRPAESPRFRSVEEEAAVWDTHSPLDYPDTWEPEKEARSRPGLQHMLAVRVDAATIAALGAVARKKGVGPSTLARMWLLERLAQEQAPETASPAEPVSARRRAR